MRKLIRDRVPDTIRASGKTPIVRVASREEYRDALRDKLLEEVYEFFDDGSLEELADIYEVLLALAETLGLTSADLESARLTKLERNGGFREQYLWFGNSQMVEDI